MSKIGQRLMVHPTSATNIVQRLEGQGSSSARPTRDDGRGTLAASRGSERRWRQATRDLVDRGFGLTGARAPAELEQLFALLRKVRLAAGDFTE